MTSSAMQVLGIFIGALILWLTLSIDWPSLLALAALVTVPELTMGSVLANSLGNSTVAFLLFTFMCTYAISKTSFVKRCAILFISSRIARRSPWCFLILYCASILVIGLVMSPSVVFVIYLPILRAICEELELRQDDRLANALMLGQLFSSAISCGMTPIAHVFPHHGHWILSKRHRHQRQLYPLYGLCRTGRPALLRRHASAVSLCAASGSVLCLQIGL